MSERAEIDFIESLGLIVQNDGLPRIAGRLLGLFVLHGGPFSFAELSERLQISRGSVSTNTRLLEDLGAIERVAKPGERQDFFRLAENPYEQLIERFVARSQKARATISRAVDEIDGDEKKERLEDLFNFYKVIGDTMTSSLEELRRQDGVVFPAPRPNSPLRN